MKHNLFSVEEPVHVFTFFTELTEYCDNLDISEALAFMALRYLIN